jgi:nucleotide-binding universal stress UspA family protein
MKTLPWNKVLVTTDFSDVSLVAWSQAKAIAAVQPVTITALHVAEPSFEGLRIQTEGFHDDMRAQSEAKLEVLVKSRFVEGEAVASRVEDGRAATVICKVARSEGIDLIVISSHGHSGLKHVLLGSVVADVVRHAPCAVLVVPAEAR